MADDIRPIIKQVENYRASLMRTDAEAIQRLVETYQRLYGRLQDKIDLLILEIGNVEGITKGQVMRMERYQTLMAQVRYELNRFQASTINEVERLGELGLTAGIRSSHALMEGMAKAVGVNAQFNVLPKEVIKSLLGFLDPQGALFARLGMLAEATAEATSQTILDGVGLGYNPKKIARNITNALGMGLTDSIRNVRTVQLWSYREANRANYVANSDVLAGWVWHADLSTETCASCIAMHGTVHSLDEVLNDHYNGRCAPIPLLVGQDNPLAGAGEAWFTQQDEATQKGMLGEDKWAAWKEGKFGFSDLTGNYQSEVYGSMRVEKSLKELIGQELE